MVSIKSLAVLFFAAVVTAAPLAGEKHGGHHGGHSDSVADANNICGNGQELHCCNDAESSKDSGLLSFLNGVKVKCNNLGVDVFTINPLTGNSQCKATIACCSKKTEQTGIVNADADLSCVAPGLN